MEPGRPSTIADPNGSAVARPNGVAALVAPVTDGDAVTDVVIRPDTIVDKGRQFGHWLLGAHWLGRWHTPSLVRFWRYSAGSVVAYLASGVVFYICVDGLGFGAGTCTVVAFVAGALPNWVLNRRWAWQRSGREGLVRETVLYALVTGASLAVTLAVTKLTAYSVNQMNTSHMVRGLLLTSSYLFTTAVLWVLKYVAYDRLVFKGHRPPRGAARAARAPGQP
jgi:putative flippase GtrA